MAPSRNEVEIKLRFDSARDAIKKLEQLGAVPVEPRAFEDNQVYDLASGELRRTSRLLRLRRKGTVFTVTFKSKVDHESRHKVYLEHETKVEDAEQMHLLLTSLGYTPWYRYQKYRTVYRLDDAKDRALLVDWIASSGDEPVRNALLHWLARVARDDETPTLETVLPPKSSPWIDLQLVGWRVRPTRGFLIARWFNRRQDNWWLHRNWYYTLGDLDPV